MAKRAATIEAGERRRRKAPGRRSTPAGRLALDGDRPLGEGIAGSMKDILHYTTGMAARAERDPAQAVHEWRKSLRRARALLRLVRGDLQEGDHDRIGAALRNAQQATSTLRDADALRPVIRALMNQDQVQPAQRRVLDRLERGLGGRGNGGQARRTTGVLAAHVGRIDAALGRFERGLPAALDWDDLRKGLKESYARARRALRRLRKDDADERFHDLRKAVKVLHYQAELLASTGHPRAQKLRKRLSDLAEAQGEVTDLMVLRAHLSGASAEQATGVAEVEALIDREIADRRKPALRQARKLLSDRPADFARRLVPG